METILRILATYVFLLFAFRVMGKRELNKLSPFELVTLMLVSEIFSQAMAREDFSMTNALIAVSTLCCLVVATSLLTHRFVWFERVIEAPPTILVEHGRILIHHMDAGFLRRCVIGALVSASFYLSGCGASPDTLADFKPRTTPEQLFNLSPWFAVRDMPPHDAAAAPPQLHAENQVELLIDFCGWNPQTGEREVVSMEIIDRAVRMIAEAEDVLVMSFFLFDNLHAREAPPEEIAGRIGDAILARRREHPEMPIVLILDLLHKAWDRRESEIVRELRDAGVIVVYSDVLGTRAASRFGMYHHMHTLGRMVNPLTFGLLDVAADLIGRAPLPIPGGKLDGEQVTLNMLAAGLHFKANHRKLIVSGKGGRLEAMVTSWNPHDPSAHHANHALVLHGDPAAYVYALLRADVAKSLQLAGRYVDRDADGRRPKLRELDTMLPPGLGEYQNIHTSHPADRLPDDVDPAPPQQAKVAIASESAIEAMLLHWLQSVGPGDEVRVQMFYLSRIPVLQALLDAAERSEQPVKILLDPNRTGINTVRDGTPNVQAARFLLQQAELRDVPIEVRWYATSGEQNHAKAMSIINPTTGKAQLMLGSANWTRKNLAGINLEANAFVESAPGVTAAFNDAFDVLWFNRHERLRFSLAWDDPAFSYHVGSADPLWAYPDPLWFLSLSTQQKSPTHLLENELVHW